MITRLKEERSTVLILVALALVLVWMGVNHGVVPNGTHYVKQDRSHVACPYLKSSIDAGTASSEDLRNYQAACQ